MKFKQIYLLNNHKSNTKANNNKKYRTKPKNRKKKEKPLTKNIKKEKTKREGLVKGKFAKPKNGNYQNFEKNKSYMEEFILYKLNRNPNYSLCFGKGKFIDFNIFNFINTNRVTTLNERM